MKMNDPREKYFIETFIQKNRRERLLHEFTDPGKRYAGISRFCHQADAFLDPKKIQLKENDLERQPAFEQFVCSHDESVLILSPDSFLNERELSFSEAVREAVMNSDAVIILGSSFAAVFAEAEKGGRDKYLLF